MALTCSKVLNQGDPDTPHLVNKWKPAAGKFTSARRFGRQVRAIERGLRVAGSTIHGTKGAEWPYVIILNVVDGVLPDYRSLTETEVDADRNLLYVAVTRAQVKAYLLQAPAFTGDTEHKTGSRFLDEDQAKAALKKVTP